MLPSSGYQVGSVARLTAVFTDTREDRRVDPEDVVCSVKPPTRPAFEAQVKALGNGVYEAEVPIDTSGTWLYAFDSKGAHQASAEGKLFVGEQLLPR